MFNSGGAAKQGILSLQIKDKAMLYASYMPFIKNGGIFVATTRKYNIGDDVFLLLSLMDDKDRMPVPARVVWITPAGAQGNRPAGIGVQFNEGSEGDAVRTKIESNLAGMLSADKPTATM
jgi:type IV pilus assembly protein PilZ